MAKLTLHVPMRWSDIDGYGHVNNAKLLSLLEEARITAFWSGGENSQALVDGGIESETHTLIARQEVEYLRPLPYSRQPVRIDLWVCRLGGASVDVGYEVFDDAGEVAVRAITVIVLVDGQQQRPRRLTDAERAGWQQWVDERPAMRHK